MDDAFVITIGNANRLQESFEGFLHNNKYVVGAMASACSPTDAHIYMKLSWNGEFEIFLVTQPYPHKHSVFFLPLKILIGDSL